MCKLEDSESCEREECRHSNREGKEGRQSRKICNELEVKSGKEHARSISSI